MSETWVVFIHKQGTAWKPFAKCDDYFHAAWIRNQLVETGFFPESDTDITKENSEVKQ